MTIGRVSLVGAGPGDPGTRADEHDPTEAALRHARHDPAGEKERTRQVHRQLAFPLGGTRVGQRRLRQHPCVEDEDVDRHRLKDLQCRLAGARLDHLEFMPSQSQHEEPAKVLLVVHDEDRPGWSGNGHLGATF